MKRSPSPSRVRGRRITFTLGVVLAALAVQAGLSSSRGPTPVVANKYIGAAKCKNCHKADEGGNQYAHWEKGPHAKAFETLASDEAKKIAAEMGIEDPQKADQCLKCHTTAFGVDAKLIKKGFKVEMGVQCESCHGPGDDHMKARFKAAAAEAPDQTPEPGEVVGVPPMADCQKCHNKESPTFKDFCYYERVETIRHSRPLSDEERGAQLVCGCDPCECSEGCPDDGCAVPRSSKGE